MRVRGHVGMASSLLPSEKGAGDGELERSTEDSDVAAARPRSA